MDAQSVTMETQEGDLLLIADKSVSAQSLEIVIHQVEHSI
ncbi:hypothetical protein SAMN06265370_14410 [Puniceibacterium sediminis]|uniref:Uncharacterized protein n=1 Tax=Puniceibacterium sediminis TaxID=1608407 RepID=A0A238ZV14_9RHOB|nr:hypothetical protein SAMN06265370_14410 [Puniceibacterium sediminis]